MTNDNDARVEDMLPIRLGQPVPEAELDPGKADGLAELRAQIAARRNSPASITCPACGMRSYHPMDVEQGYCGFCHGWTS